MVRTEDMALSDRLQIELTPSGKIIKAEVRKIAGWHWEQRSRLARIRTQPTANL